MLKLNANFIANHSLGFLTGFHLGSTQAVGLLVEVLNQPRISSEFNVHSSFFCLSILIPVMNFFCKKMVQMLAALLLSSAKACILILQKNWLGREDLIVCQIRAQAYPFKGKLYRLSIT